MPPTPSSAAQQLAAPRERVRRQALPLPRLPAHSAGRFGLPPTCCELGCVGMGAPHCPPGVHALWGLLAVGVVGGRPRGGWPATVLRGVWCQALSLPRPPVLWGGQPGFCDPCVPGAVSAGVGTQHRPGGARLRAGVARPGGGRRASPGGVPSAVVRGAWGQALPLPRLPALWAGCRGPLPTGCGCGGVRAWAPSPTPQPALLPAGFARCGGGTRAPGGGASCLGVKRPGSRALPPPAARPLGGLSGPATHWPWVLGAAGVGTRHQPHSARSCVLWGRHEGARGGRLLPGCGASGVGRSPTPDCPPSGRAAGAHYPPAVGAGG